jgi:hypothetical protein
MHAQVGKRVGRATGRMSLLDENTGDTSTFNSGAGEKTTSAADVGSDTSYGQKNKTGDAFRSEFTPFENLRAGNTGLGSGRGGGRVEISSKPNDLDEDLPSCKHVFYCAVELSGNLHKVFNGDYTECSVALLARESIMGGTLFLFNMCVLDFCVFIYVLY